MPSTNTYYLGDDWILNGAKICRQAGFEVETDTNAETLPASYPMSHIAIYAGWYAADICGPLQPTHIEFMPGAFAYHLYSYSADTLRSSTRNWCGPLLARGATCTMGCVYEPYLQFTPNIALFLQGICDGYTFGEAAWAAQIALSWQTTVIGDPLYQPFKKSPPDLHAQLVRTHNPLVEWSINRLVNLSYVHGLRKPLLAKYLEEQTATAHSAILTEKLADLYDELGKPESAIRNWQQALTLNPSPQQRLRLRLTLGEKLIAENRLADAAENYRTLLTEAPDYPGKNHLTDQLKQLEQKLAGTPKP